MLMTWWSMVPPAGWASAAFAGVAVLLALARPGGRWRRVSTPSPPSRWRGRLAVLIRGRPDAAPPMMRLVGAAAAATVLCLGASRLVVGGGAGAGGGAGSWVWAAWPVLTAGGLVALGWLEPQRAKRRRSQLVMDAPQALELMSACLAAGMPVRSATRSIVAGFGGPVAEDLGRVRSLVELGVPDAEAWLSLQSHPQLGAAAADLARSVDSGTMLESSLRQHARVAREARRGALQVRARAVGVRSVLPLMVCFIPSFLLLGVVPTVVSAVRHALG